MATAISWTTETWNPVVGCTKVGDPDVDECAHCYAIDVAHRAMQPAHVGLTVRRPGERADWSGVVRCLPERLEIPSRWRAPRFVFVNSMSDLFHPLVPGGFIARVFAVMSLCPQHTFQVLTKRPQAMARRLAEFEFRVQVDDHRGAGAGDFTWPLPNVWAGTSIGRDKFSFRARHVRATPAAVRFLSLEPLLEPLPSLDLTGIDWVIVGGESGPAFRPMEISWLAAIVERCAAAGIPVWTKQDSHRFSGQQGRIPDELWIHQRPEPVAA